MVERAPRRQRRLPDTLGARLGLVLVTFIVVVAVVVAGAQYWQGRRVLTIAAAERLDRDAVGVAGRLAHRLSDLAGAVAVWSVLEASQDIAIDDVDKRLSMALQRLTRSLEPAAQTIALDTLGRVVAASDASLIGRTTRDVAWTPARCPVVQTAPELAGAAADRRIVVAAPVVTSTTPQRIGCLVLAAPWPTVVRSITTPIPTTAVAIADERGTFAWRGDAFAPGAPTSIVGRARGRRGAPWAWVMVAEPRADALAAVRESARTAIWLGFAVLALALPAAWLAARSATRSLGELASAALAVRSDEYPVLETPSTRAPQEVQVLHGALETMLTRQEEARHALAEREVLASLGTVAAALAHEIRTPLAVVHGSVEMLGRGVADDARRAELVSLVTTEVARLEKLVGELLAFARPSPPDRTRTDLASVCARAAEVLAPAAASHGVRLELECTPTPAWGDPEQLQQVVMNLTSNAIEASPSGSVVTLVIARRGERAMVEVRDRGPGIPAEARDRIWAPFFTTRRRGTGLGLAIARRIVDAHDGTIEATDTPGGGTTMRVLLPVPVTTPALPMTGLTSFPVHGE